MPKTRVRLTRTHEYFFEPLDDITPYELAVWFIMIRTGEAETLTKKSARDLPKEVSRHLQIRKSFQ